MQARPTIMAAALFNAAIRASSTAVARSIINHASTDDPKRPFASGYNRAITDNIRVNQATLNNLYKE